MSGYPTIEPQLLIWYYLFYETLDLGSSYFVTNVFANAWIECNIRVCFTRVKKSFFELKLSFSKFSTMEIPLNFVSYLFLLMKVNSSYFVTNCWNGYDIGPRFFRDLPLAIMIGIPLVTGCYVLVNIAYLTVLSSAEIATSSAVAVVSGCLKIKSISHFWKYYWNLKHDAE